MNTKRIYFVMIGVVGLTGALLIASTVLADIQLRKQAAKLHELRLEGRLIREQETALLQANNDLKKYGDLEETAKRVVPQDKDQARTVREINKIAAESGIELASVTFPASNLGQVPARQEQAEGEASTAPSAPPLSQVKTVEGIPGVYAMEVVITSNTSKPITYQKLIEFLERLERNRRTAHVDKITVTPSSTGSNNVTFSLTLNAYVKP